MSRKDDRIGFGNATLHLGRRRLETLHGDFDVHFFRDLTRERTAMAVAIGDLGRSTPLLARVHSSCLTSECLMGRDCDCAEQLDSALATMARAGRGVLFYLMQEGRGAGLTAKARDRMIVQASQNRITTFEAYAEMGLPADLRRYEEVAPICRLLGIRAPLRLLTNNPEKAAAVGNALADQKIEICGTEPIHGPTSPFNRDYLSAKHESGHVLDQPSRGAGAMPPTRVRVIQPVVLPGASNRLMTASYFLPVALPPSLETTDRGLGVEWFRLSVIFDGKTARESIVLSLGDLTAVGEAATSADERLVTMSLFDRLPGRRASGRLALRSSLLEIRELGRGAVSVCFNDSFDDSFEDRDNVAY